MTMTNQIIIAEISIISIGNPSSNDNHTTSMSKEIAVAFNAISQIKDIKATLTPMGTQIESNNIQNVLKAVEVAHQAIKEMGVKRIISTIRIDERLDKAYTLEDKVKSVKEKLPKKQQT